MEAVQQEWDRQEMWCGHEHEALGTTSSKRGIDGAARNEHAVAQAQDFLRRALELDSTFALARAQFAPLSALAQTTGLAERFGRCRSIRKAAAA